MRKRFVFFLAALAVVSFAFPAFAHFQMIYTPESALNRPAELDLKLIFTHPFEGGHTMDMAGVEAFFMVHREERTDLKDSLRPTFWSGDESTGKAYEAKVRLRGMGDFVFGLVPAPYYEPSEESWMQQCTKVIVNVAGLPTDWESEIGLPVEIVPLAKPYALWTGNVFSGIVKADGKPVPFAEVEVEFLNHRPDVDNSRFFEEGDVEAPQDSFVTQTIRADAKGTFVYAIPRAGWWGFAALGVKTMEHKGSELSQDAVIWVQTRDMQ